MFDRAQQKRVNDRVIQILNPKNDLAYKQILDSNRMVLGSEKDNVFNKAF